MIKETKRLPIELIRLSGYARERRLPPVDPRALELARDTEIIAPAVVRSIGNPGYPQYELLSGAESWSIAQHLLLPTIPAVILDGLSEAEAKAYVEVHERQPRTLEYRGGKDWGDPLAWAEAALQHIIRERKQRADYSQKEAARTLGLDHTTLSHGLRMVKKLRAPARAALTRGSIALGHAKALTAFAGIEQDQMVERIVLRHASVRETEETAATCRAVGGDRVVFKQDVELMRLEGHIAAVTGIPIKIEYHKEKQVGRVILEFAGLEMFDAILARLGVSIEES